MEIKKQIVKIIKDETPINVKFKGKEISCEIKESQFVEKIEKFIQSLLDEKDKEWQQRCKEAKILTAEVSYKAGLDKQKNEIFNSEKGDRVNIIKKNGTEQIWQCIEINNLNK